MLEDGSAYNPVSQIYYGYAGKVLRVDLSSGKAEAEKLPDASILRKYIGGQALSQWILLRELKRAIHPYSPENILSIMTGPLTGTGKTPAGTAYTVTTLSNCTGFGLSPRGAIVSSSGMGFWGPMLKFAGYDGILITGAASKPVYLLISDDNIEIRDASHIWGLETHKAIALIQKEIGHKASVAAIGPAGENLVPASMICNDFNHSASHGGGAIMGSKKLKAIAVYGTGRVPVFDAERLVEAGRRWRSKITPYLYPKPGAEGSFTYHQTRNGPGYGSRLGGLVKNNWQTSVFPEANKDWDKQEYTGRACYKCNRVCPYDAKLTSGKHAGTVATLNAGSEHFEASAFTFGIGGSDVRYLVEVMDNLGLEATHFGCTAGLAFEAYEKGLLTSKDTDGLELKWGDAEIVEILMRKVALQDGAFAKLLAQGPRATAERIGNDAIKFAVYLKHGVPAFHDWRPHTGFMLGQLVNSGGSKSQFAGFEVPQISLNGGAPDLGYSDKTNSETIQGKAKETLLNGLNRYFMGACGICWFGIPIERQGILQDVRNALMAATGWDDFDLEEALKVGERAWQMEHLFHLHYGWTPKEDIENVGARFLEPIPDGKYKGFTVAKFLPGLIYDFYHECGWDEKTGRPKETTLRRLGLEEFSQSLE